MTNGFGAGFGALMMFAVLLGLATLLTVTLVATLAFVRRDASVPAPVQYLAVALLAGVLVVAIFGVAALFDEGPLAAALLLVTTVGPLAGAWLSLRRVSALGAVARLAAAAMAWCLPFVAGLVVFVCLTLGVESALDLSPAAVRGAGLAWVAAAVAGAITLGGALALARSVAPAGPSVGGNDGGRRAS